MSEVLKQHDTLPTVDREKLLNEAQNRELDRLFSSLESDRFSLQDIQKLLMQIGQNIPKTRPHIAEFIAGRNEQIKQVLRDNRFTETIENPETTKKLNMYQTLTTDIQKSLKDIQNSLNDSTSLSLKLMDSAVGLFSDDTVFNRYNSSFESVKSQAQDLLGKIKSIDPNSLSTTQKQVYDKLVTDLTKILSLKLESTGIVQMGVNEIKNRPQDLFNAVHGVKGEVIGLYEGTKAIITGSVELLTFMIKYPFSSEYRQEVNNQAEIIYDFVKKEGLSGVGNKVYEAIGKEMDRISKLPPEKQAEEIGKIAGNVISMLAVIKAGTTIASKLGKVGQAERLVGQAEAVGNTARAERIREVSQTLLASKNGFKTFDILLTGVAETALLKGLSASYKSTLVILENIHLPNISKVEFIEQEINKVKQMKGETPEEQQILERYVEELELKKKEIIGDKAEILNIIDIEFRDYKYFQEVLKKFILDNKHNMNITNYLINPETRTRTIQELKEILKLGEKHVSHEEMVNIIKSIYEGGSSSFNTINFQRTKELRNKLLSSNPELYKLGENVGYNQRRLLKEYAEKLSTETLPKLKSLLTQVIGDIPIENGFPSISARAKSADGIMDKIGRMKAGNDGKKPRPDYNLSDMPDAVGGRIAVTDISQLQEMTKRLEDVFGKENIFEVDNFYTSSKKENSYRVITYTALVDGVPCEIQLTTLKSSLVADLWHNTGYKKIHQLPKEIIEKLANLQRQTTLHEHSLIK